MKAENNLSPYRDTHESYSPCFVPAAGFNGLNCGASASNQLEYQCNHSQHQQYVDKSTHGVAADHSQQPENKQNHK
jgi:hypothetical protein